MFDRKKLKTILIVVAVLVVGLIALAVATSGNGGAGQGTGDDNEKETATFDISKIYEIDKTSPYLIICFTEELAQEGASLDAGRKFTSKFISVDGNCANFSLNTGRGVGRSGEFQVFVTATAQSGAVMDRREVLLSVAEALDPDSEATVKQNEAVLKNSSAGIQKTREADPIYQYLAAPLETAHYTLTEAVDEFDEVALVIYLHMPQPSDDDTAAAALAQSYKDAALEQIRGWGFNPNDYRIQVKYDG
jgi:hypothetical protein